MKRKIISSILAGVMAMTVLSSCGGGEQLVTAPAGNTEPSGVVTDPTELTFIFADGDEGVKTAMNEMVNKFNSAHNDITVKISPGNGGVYNEFLKTKDSVGEFPDIVEMRDTATYVRAEKLEPLSSEITNLFKTTVEFDGNVYTAPMGAENTFGVIYNKKYFDDNDLTEPATYDEFIKLCQDIKDKGDMSPLVVGGQDIWHMGFIFSYSYNNNVLTSDADFIKHAYEGIKDFSDDSFKAVFAELQEIMKYAQDGWASTPDAQITTFLVNNMAAMMYSGTHMFSQIEQADPNFEMGWFPIPGRTGELNLIGGPGASGLSISKEAATEPNKKAAAEEFIKFFYAPENYPIYVEAVNFVPTTKAEPTLNVSPLFQEVIGTTNTADSLVPMWNARIGENELPPDFRNFTYKTIIEVLQGTRDINSACDELNKSWQVSIQSFNPVLNK